MSSVLVHLPPSYRDTPNLANVCTPDKPTSSSPLFNLEVSQKERVPVCNTQNSPLPVISSNCDAFHLATDVSLPENLTIASYSLRGSQERSPPSKTHVPHRALPPAQKTRRVGFADSAQLLNKQSFANLLQKETHVDNCHYLHDHLLKVGLDHNAFFENMTLNMYGRCGHLDDALCMFLCSSKDTAAWNAMINIYGQHGHHKDALQLFFEMQHQSVELTKVTFISVLNSCDHPAALMDGKIIHASIIEYGHEGNERLGSALVGMYGKCGSVDAACIMFHRMHLRNVVSWTTMISIMANNSLEEDAFELLEVMQESGVSPSNITFLALLCGLHDPCMVDMGSTIHASIVKFGVDTDSYLGTTLIKMYGEFALLEEAQHVFDNLHERTIVSWNVLIDAYAQNQEGERALQIFWDMQDGGLKPDDATFVGALNACLSLDSIADGRAIHGCIRATRFKDHVVVSTALVNMYGRCGDLGEASAVFESMCHRNAVSWNTLIAGYTLHGFGKEPLHFFHRMLEEGVMVNKLTYVSILGACEVLSNSVECKRFHAAILGSEYKMDHALATAIINVYGKCGDLEEAHKLFEKALERDLVLWNVIISAYVQHGHEGKALAAFTKMQQGEPTLDQSVVVTALKACSSLSTQDVGKYIHTVSAKLGLDVKVEVGTSLVSMYGKWGALEEANLLFIGLSGRNIVTWNAMIAVYAQHGCIHEAMECLQKMKEEQVQPDGLTFTSIISMCANSSTIEEGKALHQSVISEGLEQCMNVGTALLSMYGKCGDLEASQVVFDKMHEQGVVAWNCMLATYAHLGLGRQAYEFYLHMLDKGPTPDAVTFLSILSACSHSGLLEEGLSCFASMRDDYKIEPQIEHFGCMVDLYGRSGELKQAERFIYRMGLEGQALVWRTLLGSCKLHKNVEIGRRAAEFAMNLEPENPIPLVLLSDLLTKGQMWEEVVALREKMIERGLSNDKSE